VDEINKFITSLTLMFLSLIIYRSFSSIAPSTVVKHQQKDLDKPFVTHHATVITNMPTQ